MPRHPVSSGARNAAATKQDPSAPQAMPGGAAGMPDPGDALPMAARNPYGHLAEHVGRPQPKAREYMVTDGPRGADGKIRYNSDGFVCGLNPGKVVTEASHNLDAMKKQGIVLQAMPYEVEVDDNDHPVEEPAQSASPEA